MAAVRKEPQADWIRSTAKKERESMSPLAILEFGRTSESNGGIWRDRRPKRSNTERKCNAQSHVIFVRKRGSRHPRGNNVFGCTIGAGAAAGSGLQRHIRGSGLRYQAQRGLCLPT